MMEFKAFLGEAAGNRKDNPFMMTTTCPQHPTGFMYMDYAAGSYLNVFNDDEIPLYTYHNVGIPSGSVITLIAKSQGGKTTLAIQMGVAVIEPYFSDQYYSKYIKENMPPKYKQEVSDGMPFIQIVDTEKTLPMDYVKKLSHYRNKELKQRVVINQITTDKELIEQVEKHIKYKIDHMTPGISPMLDLFGNPIKEYPPTVLIVDSMTQLLIESVDDPTKMGTKKGLEYVYDSATQGPAGARRAKIISALYSQLVNYSKKYNIIIISVNHINKMPAMMGIPVKQARFLRASETIPGGERPLYLTASILRLDVIKAVNSISSSAVNLGDNITGHIAVGSWVKCKTNSKNNTFQLGFTDKNGYDPLLSTLWFAKERGDLAKKGNYYYVDKHADLPFTFKNYADVFGSHPELFLALYDQIKPLCEPMLDNPDTANKAEKKLIEDIRDEIHDDDNYSHGDKNDLDDMFASLMND